MTSPLHLSVAQEDPGRTPFGELVTAHYNPTPPEDVRDRIELPALSPTLLDDAVHRAVRGFTRRPGRHNRYMPVPGEHSLRTDDLVDFLVCYGHEYQLAIFRAADIRTGSLLDVAAVHDETLRQSSASAWDWTGASDWHPADAIPADAAFVFWSAHTSLVDGSEIPAGFWEPGRTPPPEVFRARTPFADEAVDRMRALAGSFVAALGDTSLVRHPGGLAAGLPVVVLDCGDHADALTAAVREAEAVRAVLRHGTELTIVPHPDADAAAMTAIASAAAAIEQES
jgi:hypothetical protein